MRPWTRLALLAAALGAAGCRRDAAPASDTSFARDLALAGADTTAQPSLRDQPATPPVLAPDPGALTRGVPAPTPAPTKPAPRGPAAPSTPAPAAGALSADPAPASVAVGDEGAARGGAVGTIPGGSTVRLSAGQRICTHSSRVGDRFTATVTEAVEGSNGVRIPPGSTIVLEATQMRRGTNARERPVMGFAVVSLIVNGVTYPVTAEVAQVQVEEGRAEGEGTGMKKVATGAAIGAIVGQIMGRDTRSTVTGAAAGAVLGAAAAVVTANFDGCVPGGGRVDVRITEPLQIRA